jgi:putative hemolysin
LLARPSARQLLELGRTCILKPWRDKRAVELLWAAIWNYARWRRAEMLLGCASFPGTNSLRFAEPLSLLYHFASAPAQWQAKAHPHCFIRMDWLTPDRIDRRRAMRALPPLVRGYLRLGAMFAGEAAIDRRFSTMDVLVVLPVEGINPRYVGYYGANGERHGVREADQAAFEAGDSVSSA